VQECSETCGHAGKEESEGETKPRDKAGGAMIAAGRHSKGGRNGEERLKAWYRRELQKVAKKNMDRPPEGNGSATEPGRTGVNLAGFPRPSEQQFGRKEDGQTGETRFLNFAEIVDGLPRGANVSGKTVSKSYSSCIC